MPNLGYPTGTARGFSIGVMSDEPMTKARGAEFRDIVYEHELRAKDKLEMALEHAGFKKLTVHSTNTYDFTWDEVPGREDDD